MKHFILTLLIALFSKIVLGSSVSDETIEINTSDPPVIKQKLISAIKDAQVSDCRDLITENGYLLSFFNRDIFSAMISCFDLDGKSEDCWEIFEMIEPSFADVSRSTTTPLIMALRKNKMELFNELMSLESVKKTVDNVDEYARTALMYAAKLGSFFAVRRIIEVSTESVNKKDYMDKTALHYACEMIPIDPNDSERKYATALTGEVDDNVSNKYHIFLALMSNGAKIDFHGPEYKLTSSDESLKLLIVQNGGKVSIQTNPTEIINKALIGFFFMQFANTFKITEKAVYLASKLAVFLLLNNPLMVYLNELCFGMQRFLLPGVDLNLVVSFELKDGFQDVSLNLFFVLLLAAMISSLIKEVRKQDVFEF